jgi:CRP-like cAMP-binding protein
MVEVQTSNGTTDMPQILRRTLRNFLSEQQLRDLERFCRAVVRRPGATLFRQDESSDAFFIVLQGSIELRARPPGRRVYRTVEVVGEGWTFGDEALFGED